MFHVEHKWWLMMEKLIDVRLTESQYNLLNRLESGEIGIVENGEEYYFSSIKSTDEIYDELMSYRKYPSEDEKTSIKIKIKEEPKKIERNVIDGDWDENKYILDSNGLNRVLKDVIRKQNEIIDFINKGVENDKNI